MAKRKIIWSHQAKTELYLILNFYKNRNKSVTYSNKLNTNIKLKLKALDFTITLPQKTTNENVFYFTYNHISVFFTFDSEHIFIVNVIDQRRDPDTIYNAIKD